MRYTIVSINDDRSAGKAAIRKAMSSHTEIKGIQFVNGYGITR